MKEERLTTNTKQTDHISIASSTSKEVKTSVTDVISDFLKIDKCSILKYGIKPSTEPISYGYCITCDINLIHPICSECLNICHINLNHTVKQVSTKGNIICGCGERMHKFTDKLLKQDSIISSSCPYTDYCKTANLENWFIVGTKTVCPMCYVNCGHQGKGFSVDIEQLKGEECQCENLNNGITHTDLKEIYRKMDNITKKSNIIMEEIGPIKILNMLFLGKLSYYKLYSSFDDMLAEINLAKYGHYFEIKENFLETNFFLSLKNFTKIAKKIKNAPLRYFCRAIINSISFDLIEQVVKNVIFKDTKQYWGFMDRLLYLYKKVGVGHLTRRLDKYKIYDLENLSVMQRKCLFYTNQTLFPTAKNQIDFFTRVMKLYLAKGITHLEGYDVIIQICSILKRISEFYLFSSKQMILFCFEFEKTFEYLKKIKNISRQLQLYFVVIKMLHYFLYCYNDELIYNYISKKENNNESEVKIPFIFTKNELGRLISRNVIRMMYFCFIGTKNVQLDQKETKTKKRILRHGLRIITYLISPKDCYMLSANKMINNGIIYYNIIQIPLNNPIYLKVVGEHKKLEDYYELYFTFKIYEEELLFEASKSLKAIMELSQEQDIRPLILKSNYFFTITKIFNIISFIADSDSDRNFIKLYFSFGYYFTQNNSDYALLLMSHYTLSSVLSIPILFVEDILSFYNHCTELIVNNDKVIAFSKHMIKLLFSYLAKVKKENLNIINNHPNEEAIYDIDELVSLFLKIMIKLILRTKQLNNKITIKVAKKVIINFLNIFDFEELSNHNIKCLLLLINSVFDSSSETDRQDLNSLINNDTLIETLKDYAIDLDYRIEILRYLKKFKFSIYYTQNVDTPQIIITSNCNVVNTSMSNGNTEQRNYEYLNVFDGDKNNFPNFNQNPLVSNYQYPIKYLTMFYNMITINANFESTPISYDNSKNIITIIINELFILEKEIMHLKDIYQKYSSNMPKFMNYFAKALVTPLCVVVKKLFSFTHLCDGNSILYLYNMTMKFLYLKNYFFNLGDSFTQNLIGINIPNFNVKLFLSKTHQQETLDDYFEMKDGTKFSPFDYTRLYIILDRHLFNFLSPSPSLELYDNFGNENNEALCSEYISSGEVDLNYSVQKTIESGNPKGKLFHQNIYSSSPNKLLLTTLNTMENQKALKVEEEKENKPFLPFSKKKLASSETIQKQLTKIYISYLKTKAQLDVTKSSLFVSFPEICIEYEKNFRKMLVSILIYLSGIHDQYSSECYMILYKMLSIETGETQMDIMETLGAQCSQRLGFLSKFAEVLYSKIVKIIISDFSVEPTYNESTQITAFNVIKILKFLCEEHNNFFQEKILLKLNYKYEAWTLYEVNGILERGTEEASMTFFNFLVNVLTKILLITNKAKEEAHVAFYYDLIYGIVELLVEIIQGNKKEIISKKEKMSMKELANNENSLETFKNFVQIVTDILFDDSMSIGYHFKVRVLLISFFISILEEKTNEDLQKIIMKFLTLNRVLSSIMITLKNYFYDNTRDEPKFANYYINYSEKEIVQREFKFDYTLYNFFKEEYFHTDFSKNSEEFMLANNYYRYIKLLSLGDRLPEAYSMINQVENINENEAKKKFVLFNKKFIKSNQVTPINLVNEKEKSINIQFIEQYYVIKFFEYITRVVEVRLVEEKRRQLVIFTVPSEMIYLSEMTKTEFEHNVNRTSETSKKSELVKNVPLFQKEINYYKKRKLNCFTKMISRLDYIYVQIFVYLYAVIFNVLMIVTLQGYKEIEENSIADTRRRNLLELITSSSKIENGIDLCIDDWGVIYDTLAYIFVALNGILIISWIFIKMPLYYRLDRLKFMEEHKISSKSELTIWNKLQIAVVDTILARDYINSLIFMFVLGLVGAIMKRGEIIYAFFLLAIIDLNPTLKNMILSIRMRYNELAASGLLMIALVYFYSNIGFFFFNEDYAAEIETGIPDNYCKSLVFCFLTNIDAGIRARGGAADQMIRVSFERNFTNYVRRIFFDVTYFLICIIIMIDLVFGIIIGTFSEMRSEEIKHQIDKENHCFICHVTREVAEKNNREDFVHHREVTHNLWNYVDYMIFLKFSDLHDLNAANAFARINLDAKNICFLPSSKDYNDEDEEKEKGRGKSKIKEKEEESSESSGGDSILEKEEEYEEEEGEEEDGVVLITKSNENKINEEFVLKLQK